MSAPAQRSILLVEDNEDDRFFMKRALAAAGVTLPVQMAADGQAAIEYLSGAGPYADRVAHPLPLLMFLDLKMPRKSGLEVLEWVRSRPEHRMLLVLILTSSREETDVERAYTLGANSFLVKPPNSSQLSELMKLVRGYWLDNAQLALPPFHRA